MSDKGPKHDWRAEYLAEMKRKGFSGGKAGEDENRSHPRLGFRTGASMTIQAAPIPCQIVNVSVGGISFYSNVRLPEGQAVTITMENGFSLTLRVDSYHVEEVPPVLMVTSHKFLIGARFLSEEDGYRVVTEVLRNQGEAVFELTV